MVPSMPLKHVSGQSYEINIRVFGTPHSFIIMIEVVTHTVKHFEVFFAKSHMYKYILDQFSLASLLFE